MNWFPENERILVITIAVNASAIGATIGILFPTIFVDVGDEGKVFNKSLFWSLLMQAIIEVAVAISCLFVIKERPDIAPSAISFNQKK